MSWSPIFFDVEASGLAGGSFPVEVGWAQLAADKDEIVSGEMLVRPVEGWTAWSTLAERVHGLSRDALEQYGRPVEEVAETLDATFGDGVVLSDAPMFDERWTDRIYQALGRPRRWQIEEAIPVLRRLATTPVDRHWLSQHLDEPKPHRAEGDARLLAQACLHLRRQRQLRAQRTGRA